MGWTGAIVGAGSRQKAGPPSYYGHDYGGGRHGVVQQARAKATRQAIVQGASRVFLEFGYAQTTVSQVAKASGVTKGALYFHFDSKETLARAVIDEQNRVSRIHVSKVLGGGYSAIETLIRLGGAFAGDLVGDPVVKAGIRLSIETFSLDIPLSDPYFHWVGASESLIGTAISEGSIRADIDANALANLVVSAYTGIQLVSEVLSGKVDLAQRIEDMWRLLLPGIIALDRAEELAYLPDVIQRSAAPIANENSAAKDATE